VSATQRARNVLSVVFGSLLIIIPVGVAILVVNSDISLGDPMNALGGLWASVAGLWSSVTALASIEALLFGGGALALIVSVRQAVNTDEETTVWPLVALGGAVAVGYVLFNTGIGGIADAVMAYWWAIPVAIAGYAAFAFVSERESAGSGQTANQWTARRVRRAGEDFGDASVGLLVGIFGAASAVALALVQGLELFGDVLAQFAGEAAYLGTIVLGYLGYGGDFPGAWLIPDLSPIQFVAIALIIGGLAIAFRE
jgi:hypothetical protein